MNQAQECFVSIPENMIPKLKIADSCYRTTRYVFYARVECDQTDRRQVDPEDSIILPTVVKLPEIDSSSPCSILRF